MTNKNILIASAISGVAGLYFINQSKPYNDLFSDRKVLGMGLVGLSVVMTVSVAMAKSKDK